MLIFSVVALVLAVVLPAVVLRSVESSAGGRIWLAMLVFVSFSLVGGASWRLANPRHPSVHAESSGEKGAVTLRPPRGQVVLVGSFLMAAVAMVWWGLSTEEAEIAVSGSIGIVLLLPALAFLCWYQSRSRLVLSPNGFRVMTPHCDWEFRWEAVTAIGVGDDGKNAPAVTIHCPSTAMVSRRSLFPVPAGWRPPPQSTDGPWKIVPAMWGAAPNSLISTLIHLRSHCARNPLHREELVAMLTVPPLHARIRTSRADRTNGTVPSEFRFMRDS
ncbi:hypothetical protein [Nocardia otitidiscaviarum]|uniref:hypothetical protein n=1 Tax=Nocardia otitidiscaviarum TaxID=1823 RepID=UPI00245393A6|nr:hypothetical protein [Nocardia otitidiscaviarum]